MFLDPQRPEIDHRTIKLVVGVIALSFGILTQFFADSSIKSISESYYIGGWSRDILVGFLFTIAAFLLAYNGQSRFDMVFSRVAACAALGVALFPCKCGDHVEIVPYVHGISAALMFVILAIFSYGFFKRARSKGHRQAMWRAYIYAFCCITILAAIVTLAIDYFANGLISEILPSLTFYGETAGLIAFGISWLTASLCVPVITSEKERILLFGDRASP